MTQKTIPHEMVMAAPSSVACDGLEKHILVTIKHMICTTCRRASMGVATLAAIMSLEGRGGWTQKRGGAGEEEKKRKQG